MHDTTHEGVARYLRNNPDFFNRYPELLAELRIPHAAGSAISLVEKQLKVLREQNAQGRRRLHALIDIARQNEELAHRMHQLTLALIKAEDINAMFRTLYDALRRNFRAEKVAVRLFARPAAAVAPAGPEFVDPAAAEKALFAALIARRRPVSGELPRPQQAFLFGNTDDELASAALAPLYDAAEDNNRGGDSWTGILAIGSSDAARFKAGLGVELLANMAEVLSLILKPSIADDKA